jgi:hypothetical protein
MKKRQTLALLLAVACSPLVLAADPIAAAQVARMPADDSNGQAD